MTELRTLSEIRSTCTKAARGAGCPWGLAEEAGMAAQVLQSFGLLGVEALADLLASPRDCTCDGTGAAVCSLWMLARLSDAPPEDEMKIAGPVLSPLLLIAAVHRMAQHGMAWEIVWDGGSAVCRKESIVLAGDHPPAVADALCIRPVAGDTARTPRDWSSKPVASEAWQCLLGFCDETYVPETAASRDTGAGPDGAEDD